MKKKEKKSSNIKEWAGNSLNGTPTFQGYAFGYGGKSQLAEPVTSQVPEDFEKILQDIVEDELLKGLYERHPADQFYRDLPGSPGGMTNLAAKKQFVPVDPEEINGEDFLGPTVGGFPVEFNTPNNPNATTRSSQGTINIDTNALAIDYLPEETVGIWSSFGRGQLAAPRDWQQELEDQKMGDMTAKLPLGGMGNVSHPKTHVPNSAEYTANGLKSMKENVFNTNKEVGEMKIDIINSLIFEIICSEMAGNFANFVGSEKMLSQASGDFDKIITKYGGDYKKAEASPEWKAEMEKYQTLADKEMADKKMAAKVAGMFPQKEPLIAPFTQKPKQAPGITGPVGTASTAADKFSQRLRSIQNKKMQFADTHPKPQVAADQKKEKEQQQVSNIPGTRPSIPEGKHMSTKLEEMIAKMAREAIQKEIKETVTLFESLVDRTNIDKYGREEPADGEFSIIDGQGMRYDLQTHEWYSEQEYGHLLDMREAEFGLKEAFVYDLLEAEFGTPPGSKTKISESTLKKMVEIAVRKFIFESEE